MKIFILFFRSHRRWKYSLVVAASFLLFGCEGSPRPGRLVGKSAPEIIVQKWITSEPDRKEKFVLVDFWATWCPPCVASIPELNDIHNRFKDRLVVIGISPENEETVRSFTQGSIDYFVAIDTQARMEHQFGIHYIPYVVIVDPKGQIRWEGNPRFERSKLSDDVIARVIKEYDQISNNKSSEVAQVGTQPAIGTSASQSSKKQSIKDFFVYVICDSKAMDESLADPYNINLIQKIEPDLARFDLEKSDIEKFMNMDLSILLHYQESITAAVLSKCGAKYSREQVDRFFLEVQISSSIFKPRVAKNAGQGAPPTQSENLKTWMAKGFIGCFLFIFLLFFLDMTTDFLPEIKTLIPGIFFAGIMSIALKYMHDRTGATFFYLLMPITFLPLLWVLIRETLWKAYSKRFRKPSAPDEWICRDCGEANHVINRACIACRKMRSS